MPADALTVDLGNSRCKLRLWQSGPARARPRLCRACDVASADGLTSEVRAWLASGPRPRRVAVSSVAGQELERELHELLAELLPAEPPVDWPAGDPLTRAGLASECHDSRRIGEDRLFAARGALECVRTSALVVDAGTALTVDAVRWLPAGSPPKSRGVFLGGAIAPGPALLARAMGQGGAQLFEVEPRADVPALGRDTGEAMLAGIGLGFVGAARELVRGVGRESGISEGPVVLTGGNASYFAGDGAFGVPLLREPDLVHLGLLAACGLWDTGGDG